MQHLFEPDSRFTRFLTAVFDLILLNILLCVLTVTVVCSGAALTALYSVLLKRIRDEEEEITKGFFRAFRENFLLSAPATILLLVDVALLAVIHYALYAETLVFSPTIFVLLCILAFFLTALLSWLFPLLSRFENTFPRHLSNAVRLAIGNLPVTVLITVVNLLPFLSITVFPRAAGYLTGIWAFIGLAAGAYLNAYYLRGVFDRQAKK